MLVAYAITLLVNIIGNYEYYRSGGDWRASVGFSLSIATFIGCGYMLLQYYVLNRIYNWHKRPMFYLFVSMAISGVYGFGCMVLFMKVLGLIMGIPGRSFGSYANNGLYAALLTMVVTLAVTGIEIIRQLIKTRKDNERIQQEILQSKYEVLKNQVNPHFLFNSLNTLTTLITEDQEKSVAFVQEMSKVFRYSLQYADENLIYVTTELKVVDSYLFINRQRFGDKLVVKMPELYERGNQRVITQSVLMVVENALKHNEISTEKPLEIDVYFEPEYIVVKNTYQPVEMMSASTGIGQQNIINRYKLVTTKPVIIAQSGGDYIVKLPLL